VEVLHSVSMEIADGEFVVLVGPSGCGKTTLLRMIAGLESITGGAIAIGDLEVNDLAPKDRDIAMVFQNYALYPHMTAAQNIAFSMSVRGIKKAEMAEKIARAAKILGLEEYLDRHPRELSGGQRQRVAMGRAIVRDPKVFLFDEPLSNLDAKLRGQMRAEIKSLMQKLKATTVYVTHDQIEAMTMADRIVVMRNGVVEQVGTPLEVYDTPANLFVAGFIGSPTMNLIRGRVDGDSLGLPDGASVPLAGRALARTGDVVLGVRPEALNLVESGLEFTVNVVEPTGAETLLLLQRGDLVVTVVLRSRTDVRPGDKVDVGFDMTAVHFFDPESGRRIA
jgi:multiple sugar transport system ATP-binding protein